MILKSYASVRLIKRKKIQAPIKSSEKSSLLFYLYAHDHNGYTDYWSSESKTQTWMPWPKVNLQWTSPLKHLRADLRHNISEHHKSINLITLWVGARKGMVHFVNWPESDKNSEKPNCKIILKKRASMGHLTCVSSSWLLGRLRKQAGHWEELAARKSFRWEVMWGSKAGSISGYFSSQM